MAVPRVRLIVTDDNGDGVPFAFEYSYPSLTAANLKQHCQAEERPSSDILVCEWRDIVSEESKRPQGSAVSICSSSCSSEPPQELSYRFTLPEPRVQTPAGYSLVIGNDLQAKMDVCSGDYMEILIKYLTVHPREEIFRDMHLRGWRAALKVEARRRNEKRHQPRIDDYTPKGWLPGSLF